MKWHVPSFFAPSSSEVTHPAYDASFFGVYFSLVRQCPLLAGDCESTPFLSASVETRQLRRRAPQIGNEMAMMSSLDAGRGQFRCRRRSLAVAKVARWLAFCTV